MNEVNPRLGMVTHIEYEEDLLNEVSAGVRAHYDGLFLYGAPDVVVVNVTKEAFWARKAAIPGMSGANVPHPRQLLGLGDGPMPDEVPLPKPRPPREEQQEQYTRDIEIDPHKYYPPDVYRPPLTKLPDDLSFSKEDLEGMIAARPDSE